MPARFTVLDGKGGAQRIHQAPTSEEKAAHFRNIMGVVCGDALKVWDEIWKEFQGSVTDSCLILPEAEKGFRPTCGWPEFLERMWLLRHYVDYAKRFCDAGP